MKDFVWEDYKKQNVIDGISEGVTIYPKEGRSRFFLFQRGQIVYCTFDLGLFATGGYPELFRIDLKRDTIDIVFSKDKKWIRMRERIGLIKKFPDFSVKSKFYYALVTNRGKFVCLIPNGEGTQYLGDIYIHLVDPFIEPFVHVNLQIALFEGRPKRERYLVFSYMGESLKYPSYFLAISVKMLVDSKKIGFFLPE